jgi:hypothetical protein
MLQSIKINLYASQQSKRHPRIILARRKDTHHAPTTLLKNAPKNPLRPAIEVFIIHTRMIQSIATRLNSGDRPSEGHWRSNA